MILCMMFMWLYVIWFISMSWAIIWWWLLTLLNCLIGSPVILETIMLSIFISLDHCTWWLNDSTNESKMSILYAINCIHCWCSMIHMILCCIVLYCYYCLTIWRFSICWYESCVFHTIVFLSLWILTLDCDFKTSKNDTCKQKSRSTANANDDNAATA